MHSITLVHGDTNRDEVRGDQTPPCFPYLNTLIQSSYTTKSGDKIKHGAY